MCSATGKSTMEEKKYHKKMSTVNSRCRCVFHHWWFTMELPSRNVPVNRKSILISYSITLVLDTCQWGICHGIVERTSGSYFFRLNLGSAASSKVCWPGCYTNVWHWEELLIVPQQLKDPRDCSTREGRFFPVMSLYLSHSHVIYVL